MSFAFYLTFLINFGRTIGLPLTIPFDSIQIPFDLISLMDQKVWKYTSFVVIRHGPELEEMDSGGNCTESEVRQARVLFLTLLFICWDCG